MDGVNSQHRIALSLEPNTLVLASDSATIKYSDITSIEMRWRWTDTKTERWNATERLQRQHFKQKNKLAEDSVVV